MAAVSMAVAPAMASKARLSSLNNAASVLDTRDFLRNPAQATTYGDFLTFEMGSTAGTNAAASGTKAEGGFSRSMDDARWGFYMGNNYTFVTEQRANVTFEATALAPENMINLFYASKSDLAWGIGLGYSNTDRKTTKITQSAIALSGGILMNGWNVALTLGLQNKYKDEAATTAATRDFKGTTAANLDVLYEMGAMTYSFGYGMNGAKVENGSGTEVHNFDWMNYYVGAERAVKAEGSHFFYGVKYTSLTNKDKVTGTDSKLETSKLPVYAGIEADAASWLVLRASVQQNFILGTTQTSSVTVTGTAAEKDSIANDTTVAAGAGLKFGKLMIDGTLSAANSNTAALNGNSLLAAGSLTYMF